jgi:hypothetical protein
LRTATQSSLFLSLKRPAQSPSLTQSVGSQSVTLSRHPPALQPVYLSVGTRPPTCLPVHRHPPSNLSTCPQAPALQPVYLSVGTRPPTCLPVHRGRGAPPGSAAAASPAPPKGTGWLAARADGCAGVSVPLRVACRVSRVALARHRIGVSSRRRRGTSHRTGPRGAWRGGGVLFRSPVPTGPVQRGRVVCVWWRVPDGEWCSMRA